MDENVRRDLVQACVRLAELMTEADEAMERAHSSRAAKAQKEALEALRGLLDEEHFSFDHLIDLFWQLYRSSPAQSKTRQYVMQVLMDLARRRDIPFRDAVEAAHTLYRIAPNGSQEKQQAIQLLLMQAQWPGVTMKQSVEAVLALCLASPLRSKERKQGILVLFELASRPDLSVEDAMVLMTLDADEMMLIASTPAWEKRQLEIRKQLLLALARRPDLTAEQTARITQALSFLSDVQVKYLGARSGGVSDSIEGRMER